MDRTSLWVGLAPASICTSGRKHRKMSDVGKLLNRRRTWLQSPKRPNAPGKRLKMEKGLTIAESGYVRHSVSPDRLLQT